MVGTDGSVTILSREHSQIWRLDVTPKEVEASPPPTAAATPCWASAVASATPTRAPATTRVPVDDVFAVLSFTAIPGRHPLPARWAVDSQVRGETQLRLARTADHWPARVDVSVPLDIYADPCHQELGFVTPQVGPTVEDLTQALTHTVGFRAGPVTDVTFDGLPAKAFDLDNTIDMTTCTDQQWLSLWTHDGAASATGPAVPKSQNVRPATHLRMASST